MINLRFQCPHCGQMFKGAEEYANAEYDCLSCGRRFRLEPVGKNLPSKKKYIMCYLGMLRMYVGFGARTCRRDFWWSQIFNAVVSFILMVVDGCCFGDGDGCQGLIAGSYVLVTLLPVLAIHVRRLHDTNKSGWWVFLMVMPVLNVAYLVWLVTDGDKGRNRFGGDPRDMAPRSER